VLKAASDKPPIIKLVNFYENHKRGCVHESLEAVHQATGGMYV
jgi:hypothetical protein